MFFTMRYNWYVYLHRKKCNGEIFYVGIGHQKKYSRAFTVHGRNRIWNHVYGKYDIIIEIIADKLSKSDACELENLIIELCGRRDLKTGTLVNLTDGGEGTFNKKYVKEHIDNWRKSIGNNLYDITQHIKTGGESNRAKEVLNLETGIYYETAKNACKVTNLGYNNFKQMIRNERHNYTSFRYVEDLLNNISIVEKSNRGEKILLLSTGEIFNSMIDISNYLGVNSQVIGSILSGRVYDRYGIERLNGDNSKIRRKKIILESKKNKLKFTSFKEASEILKINKNTLRTWVYKNRNCDIISKIN